MGEYFQYARLRQRLPNAQPGVRVPLASFSSISLVYWNFRKCSPEIMQHTLDNQVPQSRLFGVALTEGIASLGQIPGSGLTARLAPYCALARGTPYPLS